MTDDSEFDEFDGLDAGAPSGAPKPGHDDHGRSAAGPWFVRFAGRRTGPFDAERLRILARRGALSRVHALSVDGKVWSAATTVRAVFNADGSVVASGVRAVELEEDRPDFGDELPGTAPTEFPQFSSRRFMGSAFVRPVVVCALILATIMLALPTSRDDAGELAWWWHEGALGIAVRGLCAFAVLGGWVVAFLPPEPARAASVSAVAAVLAAAGALALAPSAPWALVIALLVPIAALLVALDASGSPGIRPMGIVAVSTAALMGVACIALGVFWYSPWTLAGMILGTVGAGGLGWAGVSSIRHKGPSAKGVFWSGIIAATGSMACIFAAAFAGLNSPTPMVGAQGAVSACLVLAFSALSWAAVHEAVESSHLLRGTEINEGA